MRDDRPDHVIGRKPATSDAEKVRAVRVDVERRNGLLRELDELSDKRLARKHGVPLVTVRGVARGLYKWARQALPDSQGARTQ